MQLWADQRRAGVPARVTAFVVCAAVAVAACGGSGEKRLTKDEYIKQADAICKRYDDKINDKLTRELADLPPDPAVWSAAEKEKVATTIRNAVPPIAQQELKELEKLKPPKDDQEAIDTMLAAVKEGNDKIAELAQGNGEQLVDTIVNGEDPNEKANQLAQEYGLQECGSNG